MKKRFFLLPIFLVSLGLMLSACSSGDEVIQTVPATNNRNMIIDSNRSPFMPNLV